MLDFIIEIHENERNFKALLNFSKIPAYKLSPDLKLYFDYTTRYAFNVIEEEMKLIENVKNFSIVDDNVMVISSETGNVKYVTTYLKYTCSSFKSMGLTCHHIFKFRELNSLPLFDKNLVINRWTKVYFRKRRFFYDSENKSPSQVSSQLGSKSNDELVNNDILSCIPVEDISSSTSKDLCQKDGLESVENVDKSECIDKEKDLRFSQLKAVSESKTVDENNVFHENKDKIVNLVVVKRSNAIGKCKGAKLRAIGLPKKKNLNTNVKKFVKQTVDEKVLTIFNWFVYVGAVENIHIILCDVEVPCEGNLRESSSSITIQTARDTYAHM